MGNASYWLSLFNCAKDITYLNQVRISCELIASTTSKFADQYAGAHQFRKEYRVVPVGHIEAGRNVRCDGYSISRMQGDIRDHSDHDGMLFREDM